MQLVNPTNRLWLGLVQRIGARLVERAWHGEPYDLPGYMERRWLVRPTKMSLGRSVRIHKILRSDSDRDFHDHPWPYMTIILDGGYTEVTPVYNAGGIYQGTRSTYYGPGSVIVRPAKHLHRLVLAPGQTATTLFICGRWEQEWGFVTKPDWKTYWKDYLADEASDKPRNTRPEQREFLCCSCAKCLNITYAHRYETPEDKQSAARDLKELIEADRKPFVAKFEVGMNGRAIWPEWCTCPRDEQPVEAEEED